MPLKNSFLYAEQRNETAFNCEYKDDEYKEMLIAFTYLKHYNTTYNSYLTSLFVVQMISLGLDVIFFSIRLKNTSHHLRLCPAYLNGSRVPLRCEGDNAPLFGCLTLTW